MGTSLSNLQILGAEESSVRAALPKAVVGRWAERFVTACPGSLSFGPLNRRANQLSKTLSCTVLAVSIFDGDALDLTLYDQGKRLTRHIVNQEGDVLTAGNPKLFCSALGLPPETAPKLKRLFTASDQEEKLSILSQLLGAPLYARWDTPGSFQFTPADCAPLEAWLNDHPLPPKVKNQGKAALIQEIPDLYLDGGPVPLFRPLVSADEKGTVLCVLSGHGTGPVIGHRPFGGFWGQQNADGTLALIPLEEDSILPILSPDDHAPTGTLEYAELGGRLVTYGDKLAPHPSFPGAFVPSQCVILADTAGLCPTPLALTLDGEPVQGKLHLLPDGGLLVERPEELDYGTVPPNPLRSAALLCYAPDGSVRWQRPDSEGFVFQVDRQSIYVRLYPGKHAPGQLLRLDLSGRELARTAISDRANDTRVFVRGGMVYLLQSGHYRQDGTLSRLTPDLKECGTTAVPYLSSLAFSPDRSLLYAAGFQSGLAVLDAASLEPRQRLRQKSDFFLPICDGQNRLWVGNGGFFECYTPTLELISRHRLAGGIHDIWPGPDGSVCVLTFQDRKDLSRVYRFS